MNKDKIVVFLDNGHCASTPGKCSPDKSLKEYAYAREIVNGIKTKLDNEGIKYWEVHPEDDYVYKTKGACKSIDSRDLVLRTTRINEKYTAIKKEGKTAFLISVHVNASGNGEWMNARGWSTWTTKGQNNSDKLADKLYDAAEEILNPLGISIRTDKSDGDRDYESDFWILKQSNCVCTLSENLFMDNKDDVKFLLSDKGKQAIIDLHVKGIKNYINSL